MRATTNLHSGCVIIVLADSVGVVISLFPYHYERFSVIFNKRIYVLNVALFTSTSAMYYRLVTCFYVFIQIM